MIPFFDPAELTFFAQRLATPAGRTYRKARPQDKADGHRIRAKVYAPTNEWARRVAERLPTYRVIADNRWLIGGGYFKQYSWARLYLDEFGDEGIYFTLGADKSGNLVYKIDFQFAGDDPLPIKAQDRLRTALTQQGVKWQWISSAKLPLYGGGWEKLIDETVAFIQKHDLFFRQLHELLTEPVGPVEGSVEESATVTFATEFPNPNIILYGPPGTGKTHRTLELAYELIKGVPPIQYADAQALFKEEQGKQIEFVTFHQNFTYEDFVQGIKPQVNENGQLIFQPKNGVFYEIAQRAREAWFQQTAPADSIPLRAFSELLNELLKPLEEKEEVTVNTVLSGQKFAIIDFGDDSITFKRGAVGGTVRVQNSTLERLYSGTLVHEKPVGNQLYYQAIVEKLRDIAQAHTEGNEDSTQIAPNAKTKLQNYVLIIDEINRANISKVFGELITLLEKDKRLGGDNPLSVTLPSGEAKFNVPANLYIIGTMNTADKSIALLDIALRRRFEFQALYPVYEMGGQRFEHAGVFEKLNQEIVRLKSRDFQIGHAYFMNKAGQAAEPLASILDKKVIPLLYEYFLNDDKKVKEALEKAGIPAHEDAKTGLLRYGAAG